MKEQNSKTLYIVLIVLIALLILAVLIWRFSSNRFISASGVKTYEVDEYLDAMDQKQISEWFENIGGEYDTAYVLRHIEVSNLEFQTVYNYVIYVPSAGKDSVVGVGTSGSIFHHYLKLELDTDGQSGNIIFCITFYTDQEMDFKVYIDGKKINTEITDVDFNLIPFSESNMEK